MWWIQAVRYCHFHWQMEQFRDWPACSAPWKKDEFLLLLNMELFSLFVEILY